MMGKRHVIVNSAIVTSMYFFCEYARNCQFQSVIPPTIPNQLHQYFYGTMSDSVLQLPWTVVLFVSMLFGTLLPDIDKKTSMLGRYVHIPVKHRTWTHTAWALFILFGLGLLSSIFGAMFVGYGLHLLIDSVSWAGICWFYPIQQYRYYPNGAFVAKNHKCKLYHAGEKSELVFMWLIVLICCGIIIKIGIDWSSAGIPVSYWR